MNRQIQHIIALVLYIIVSSAALYFFGFGPGVGFVSAILIALLPLTYVLYVRHQDKKEAKEREAIRHRALVVEFERTHPQK